MQQTEQTQLARDLCARMAAHHGGDLLVAGVVGSVARGEATEFSDLDLLVISRAGSAIAEQTLLYQSSVVVRNVIEERELLGHLERPSIKWPYWMGMLDGLSVLAGDAGLVDRWLARGRATTGEALRLVLSQQLPTFVFESYGRVRSCAVRGNERDIGHAAIEVMYEMNTALCMLNKRWVSRSYYAGFEQAFGFPLLPQGYAQLIAALWAARSIEETATLCGTLVSAYWRLLTSQGLNVTNYQKIDDVPM